MLTTNTTATPLETYVQTFMRAQKSIINILSKLLAIDIKLFIHPARFLICLIYYPPI